MRATTQMLVVVVASAIAACTGSPFGEDEPAVEERAELLGGETTVFDATPIAYSFPARNLSSDDRDVFSLGDHFFNRN